YHLMKEPGEPTVAADPNRDSGWKLEPREEEGTKEPELQEEERARELQAREETRESRSPRKGAKGPEPRHLFEEVDWTLRTTFEQQGENEVGKRRYVEPHEEDGQQVPGRVYINDDQYFEGIDPATWEFHIGGYQVLDKWLKDRKGRTLSWDDIQHYQKIVIALEQTQRLMALIDERIESWPIQ
ncbi:MAG: type ISP restriction/modification enzyme, partial [Armatimonadota bacterium]